MGQIFEDASGLRASFTGETTYGRPVATAMIKGEDVGERLIREGWAIAEPKYLRENPGRLRRYQTAEAEARKSGRGAHAFRFNTPEEFPARPAVTVRVRSVT